MEVIEIGNDSLEPEKKSDDDRIEIGPSNTQESVKEPNITALGPWNYKILFLLQKIGKKTMGYRWMHEQDAIYYSQMDNRFSIYERLILAFLGTITGAGFVNFIAGNNKNNTIIYIVITLIQLVTVFFAAIIKEYKNVKDYEKHKADHSLAAVKNAEINLDIQYQLALNVTDREIDRYFLGEVIKKFSNVLYLAPKIRDQTKKKYLAESEDNDMFNPIMIDNINQMFLNDSNNDSKLNYQIDRWLKNF